MRGTISLLVLLAFFASCRKDLEVSTDPNFRLSFSTDTVLFDTVFTTVGSTTKRFKIYNRNKSAINISEIRIANSAFASYELNVDGISGSVIKDVEIPANDSIFAFIEITINEKPTEQFPFIIEEKIEFITNGNNQQVQVEAFGQNAHFLVDSILVGNQVWNNDLPYVVYGGFLVDTLNTLQINPGVRIYMHKDAIILAKGSLRILGTPTDSVSIQGDRRESQYYNEPGQWNSIQLLPGSENNRIEYCTIKGSIFGVVAGTFPSYGIQPSLTIQNSIIKYSQATGIFGINAQVAAYNNLIFACGQYGILVQYGGNYNFIHNTIGLTNNFTNRESPAVVLSDYIPVNNLPISNFLQVNFRNNIVWGTRRDEFFTDSKFSTPALFSIENNLLRSTKNWGSTNQLNTDPQFVDPSLSLAFNDTENYQLKSSSPARGKAPLIGSPLVLLQDALGVTRSNPCSYGCFE
jgi:hypothetical protein